MFLLKKLIERRSIFVDNPFFLRSYIDFLEVVSLIIGLGMYFLFLWVASPSTEMCIQAIIGL